MRRNGFGGTNKPQLSRPGNGYGRPQKPGPWTGVAPAVELDIEMFVGSFEELPIALSPVRQDATDEVA